MTVDLRDLGVTPEHHDRQAALDILARRVDDATAALIANRNKANLSAFDEAWAAYDRARKTFTDAAYETAYGPGGSL